MALLRFHATSNLMNAARNADDDGRKRPAKALVDGAQPRAALRNISNKVVRLNKRDGPLEKKLNDKNAAKPTWNTRLAPKKQQVVSTVHIQEEKEEIVESVQSATIMASDGGERIAGSKVQKLEAPTDVSENPHEREEGFSEEFWRRSIKNIDQDDANNPQLISEYVNDVFEYMHELERCYPIRRHCLANQTDINDRMRGILIDWLVQVHLRFHLLQETLFLTVAILDRFLQAANVTKNKLQLVGVTSMWIACKYEETYAPAVSDFVYITDDAYSDSEIRMMECRILKTLDFHIGRPLAIHFLRRNSKAGEVDATTHTMAKYLMELTIIDYNMVHLNPSEIAAAALCLSMKLFSGKPWSATLAHYSKYSEVSLKPLVCKLARLLLYVGTGRLVAIRTKYQSSKFMRISKHAELSSTLVHELSGDTDGCM